MKIATVEVIRDIYPHSNADTLELVKVLNYQCVVKKDSYSIGEKIIFIQPDTVLPDSDWSEIYRKSGKRVKAKRLRGEWSFGIVEELSLLPDGIFPDNYEIGQDVSETLGIIKYEPPAPTDLRIKRNLPFSIPKTDEDRYQNVNLRECYGKKIDVTLKVDGQSASYYYKDGECGALTRGLELKPEYQNNYTDHIQRYNIFEKLKQYCTKYNINLVLRGESYGLGIQKSTRNTYSKLSNGWLCFSVYLIDEMRYTNPGEKHYFVNVCQELDLPLVPIIEQNTTLTPELIDYYDKLEKYNDNYFEGVVIKGEGFSFKVINKWYDESK
jgi:RNA ligase (TIGR02306 family)